MKKDKVFIFDTTLRDGAQTEGVDFSLENQNKIAKVLSEIGVDYIEGGWPGANPVDTEFFSNAPKFDKTLLGANNPNPDPALAAPAPKAPSPAVAP